MTYCEFCGEQISYLPFNCKYCGGTYCKKHRLPENHECTFELKHVAVVPTTPMLKRRRQQDPLKKKMSSKDYLEKGPRELRKYLKRQEKQRERTIRDTQRPYGRTSQRPYGRTSQRPYGRTSQYLGAKTLFILIIIFSTTALVFDYSGISQYIYLSLNGLIYKFTFHTIFTGLFIGVSYGDFISLFFLFIMLFILYFMARNIEISYGTKFLIKLYLIGCLFTALFYFLLRLLLGFRYPLDSVAVPIGLAFGGILALISFSIFPIMNREISTLMYFLPIRMKGRFFLIIIVLFRLIPALFYALFDSLIYLLFYLPELGGILAAYILYRYKLGRK